MLIIAGILLAAGAAGAGVIVVALLWTALMLGTAGHKH